MEEIKNAKIVKTKLYMYNNMFTFDLVLDFDHYGEVFKTISFGGYRIGFKTDEPNALYNAEDTGLIAIMRILETVGVDSWEDLAGQYIRIKDNGFGPINEIGHIMENKWFNIKDFFENAEKDK